MIMKNYDESFEINHFWIKWTTEDAEKTYCLVPSNPF